MCQLAETKLKIEDMIVYSLFPRIVPQNEEREPQNAVRVVKRVAHPKFLPLETHANLRQAKTYGKVYSEQGIFTDPPEMILFVVFRTIGLTGENVVPAEARA